METREAIMARRSVRKFTDERVSREDLEKVIEAGIWAPSATNMQPWYFLALTSDEDIDWLLVEMRKHRDAQHVRLSSRFPNHPDTVEETLGFLGDLGGSRTLILAFLLKEDYGTSQRACLQSVGAAMENMALAATDLGIANCWVEEVMRIDDEAHERFGLEVGPLLGCLVLGYAAQEPHIPKRKPGRFDIR